MASRAERFGERVQRARKRAGWNQQQLADFAGINRVTLANIEGGHALFLSTALAIYDALAQKLPDLCPAEFLVGVASPTPGIVRTPMKRRRFLRNTVVAIPAAVAAMTIDLERLEQLSAPGVDLVGAEAVTDDLLAQWYTVAPTMLLPSVKGHLSGLREHLPGPTRLLRATGRVALLAGRLHTKLDLLDKAFDDFALAGAMADDIGDAELRALVLAARAGMYSAIARGPRPGDAPRALALAHAAVDAVKPGMPRRLLAAALGRRAEEHALAGDAAAALGDLDAAEKALLEPDDGGMYFGARNAAELSAIRGSVELLLGRNQEAVATLNATLVGLDPGLAQWRAAVLADQGAAYARAGELDAAVDRLERALQLARLAGDHVSRVAGVRQRDLAGRDDEPTVKRLDQQLAEAL